MTPPSQWGGKAQLDQIPRQGRVLLYFYAVHVLNKYLWTKGSTLRLIFLPLLDLPKSMLTEPQRCQDPRSTGLGLGDLGKYFPNGPKAKSRYS